MIPQSQPWCLYGLKSIDRCMQLPPSGYHLDFVLNTLLSSLQLSIYNSHLRSKCLGRFPASTSPWGGLLHHLVDLLKSKTHGLWHQEVCVDSGTSTKTAPDEEDLGTEVTVLLSNEVRGDDCENSVPQPVGGSRESNTAGSNLKRECFSNHNPSYGTPGGCKESNGHADECNHSRSCSLVVRADSCSDDGRDELARQHAQATVDEHRSASKAFDKPERYRSRANVD